MKIYRYYVLYPDNTKLGIFMAGYEEQRIIKKYNLNSWIDVQKLNKEKYRWLNAPNMSGEYWFTEIGNKLFKEKALHYFIDRLPRTNSKAIYQSIIDLSELPNWECLVKYRDQYQIVF